MWRPAVTQTFCIQLRQRRRQSSSVTDDVASVETARAEPLVVLVSAWNRTHPLTQRGHLSMSMPEVETKVCRNCNEELPVTKFKKRSGRQANQRFTMCNRCLYVRYSRPNIEKKTRIIQQYKVSTGCADCGFDTHPMALQFDHRPSTEKKFNIGEQIGNKSMDDLWAEIAKCDVVCANCHVIRTESRWEPVQVPLDSLPLGRIPNEVKRKMTKPAA